MYWGVSRDGPARWWSRSPNCNNNDNNAYSVEADGTANNWNCSNSYGCCPALMDARPSNAFTARKQGTSSKGDASRRIPAREARGR